VKQISKKEMSSVSRWMRFAPAGPIGWRAGINWERHGIPRVLADDGSQAQKDGFAAFHAAVNPGPVFLDLRRRSEAFLARIRHAQCCV
jgi:hypothetical protein